MQRCGFCALAVLTSANHDEPSRFRILCQKMVTLGRQPELVHRWCQSQDIAHEFADHKVETIMSLKDVRPIDDLYKGLEVDATPDNCSGFPSSLSK